jgi:hypothetical protein
VEEPAGAGGENGKGEKELAAAVAKAQSELQQLQQRSIQRALKYLRMAADSLNMAVDELEGAL